MALSLGSPCLSRLSHSSSPQLHSASHTTKTALFFLLLGNTRNAAATSLLSRYAGAGPTLGRSGNDVVAAEQEGEDVLDDGLVARLASVREASEVLELIAAEKSGESGGVLSGSDCCRIMEAAIERDNSGLAMSIFQAMRRSSFDQDKGMYLERWKWCKPDVNTFTTLVLSLAASLRVSDSLEVIGDICRVRVSPGEEVPFGKIVRCPTCKIAVAVAQPQHGTQVASCSKCRYQYELVSGDIVNIESEEISMDASAWKRGLEFLQLIKKAIPAAVHSVVVELQKVGISQGLSSASLEPGVSSATTSLSFGTGIQAPSGAARTHRFATETTDLPAQQGERVTIALAAPSNVYREVGPFKFSPRARNYYPEEPLCLTNHRDGRESSLLRAPSTNRDISLINPSVLFPVLAVLATGDAASGLINPNLPQILSYATLGSLALGATLNTVVFPQISQLPQRLADAIVIKQKLLAQYDILQTRINELKGAAENEVWMLARMCQLERKIFAIGEPSYRARRGRIKKVREGLEDSLKGRVELIDSYARISSMIEIEVEMDTDVPAAESASNAESTARQIEQIMELENLEERWRIQAEANDEVERLLRSEPLSAEQI